MILGRKSIIELFNFNQSMGYQPHWIISEQRFAVSINIPTTSASLDVKLTESNILDYSVEWLSLQEFDEETVSHICVKLMEANARSDSIVVYGLEESTKSLIMRFTALVSDDAENNFTHYTKVREVILYHMQNINEIVAKILATTQSAS